MRISCMIVEKDVHVTGDICWGCEKTNGRSAQIVQGTDGKIDACIVCRTLDEDNESQKILRSNGKVKKIITGVFSG